MTGANRIERENEALGSRNWQIGVHGTEAVSATDPEIQAFASATGVAAGTAIDFHASVAGGEDFTISIFRIGNYAGAGARHLTDSPTLTGTAEPAARFDDTVGLASCDWAAAWRLDVPVEWTAGLHVAACTTASGKRCLVPFVVRAAQSAGGLCAVLPFVTYQATNRWPLDGVHGTSLAFGYTPDGNDSTYRTRAKEVSFDRPYSHTGLPAAALVDIDVIAWLEGTGLDLDYASDLDLHTGDVDPGGFGGLIFCGQEEYWTKAMRDAVTRATQHGTSLAFLSGTSLLWQARLSPAADGRPNRTLACYKSDPDPGADAAGPTTRWRDARPEQALVGVQWIGATVVPMPLIVAGAEHWFWAGTGVADGDAIEGLVKGRVDEVDRGAGAPPTARQTVLARSPFKLAGSGSDEVQNTTVSELANGALIFAAGTESWPLGLVRDSHVDARVQIATRNVLHRMAAGPAERASDAAPPTAWTAKPRTTGANHPLTPVGVENMRRGSRGWRVGAGGTKPVDDVNRQIQAYASATGVALGESIDFHVSVRPAGTFTVEIYRMGHYNGDHGRLLATGPTLAGTERSDPDTDPDTRSITCDWPVSWTLDVPDDWTSGMYIAVFTSEHGYRCSAPFVVRDPAQRDNLCVVMPFTTYAAYNQWPLDGVTGRNLYNGYVPGSTSMAPEYRSYVVSFDRPYPASGSPARFDFDLDFIRWAEESGFDLCYATSIDLHAGRIEPTRYAGLIFVGHDEYWSEEMREHATTALDFGTSLAFLEANNVYWHVRVSPDHRMVTCYKGTPDPDGGSNGATSRWRSSRPAPNAPEQLLLGIQYNGIVKQPTPLIVQEPEHWFWEGTNVTKGEAIDGVVGGEADGYDPKFGSPDGTVMLARSPYPLSNGGEEVHNTSVYENGTGAVVFSSGTNDWPAALGRAGRTDRRIQRATANLLDRMQAPRLERRLPQIADLRPDPPDPTPAATPATATKTAARTAAPTRGPLAKALRKLMPGSGRD